MKIKKLIIAVLIVIITGTCAAFAETVTVPSPISELSLSQEELISWITATSAIINYQNTNEYRLIDLPESMFRPEQEKTSLKDWWGITDADSLRGQIYSLLEGGHNSDFMMFYNIINKYGEEDSAVIFKLLGIDMEGRIPTIKALGDKWGEKGIVAWDLFRIGTLCGWGRETGYISLDEACELMETPSLMLRNIFTDWNEAVDNYLDGYCYWAGADITERDAVYNKRKAIYEYLLTLEDNIFDNSLFEAPPFPIIEETIAPTPELLNGLWTCTYQKEPYKGLEAKYYFDENGTAACYVNYLGQQIYSSGFYSIVEGNLYIVYNYYESGDIKEWLDDDELIYEQDTYRFSADGTRLITIDPKYGLLGNIRIYTRDEGTAL